MPQRVFDVKGSNDFILTETGIVRRRPSESALSRRAFLEKAARAALFITAGPALQHLLSPEVRAQGAQGASLWDTPGLSPEVTPVGTFYTISKNLWDPTVDARRWSLEVTGLVHRPFVLDYAALTNSGPTTQAYVTLTCISNEVGGDLTGNALWRGIRLRDVLQDAGVKEGAVDLVMEAVDGYTDSLPIAKAMHPDTLLVWEMNGEPLRPQHGYPARIIVPGIYGMKNVKWIRKLEVVDHDYLGFWQRRGWSDPAVVKTWSRIDVPTQRQLPQGREAVIAGLAYAGDRGVSAVEVSVDGGRTWRRAELKEPLGPYAWRLWGLRWTPDSRGRHTILVRATDGQGVTQSGVEVPVLPDGAEGYHRRDVTV